MSSPGLQELFSFFVQQPFLAKDSTYMTRMPEKELMFSIAGNCSLNEFPAFFKSSTCFLGTQGPPRDFFFGRDTSTQKTKHLRSAPIQLNVCTKPSAVCTLTIQLKCQIKVVHKNRRPLQCQSKFPTSRTELNTSKCCGNDARHELYVQQTSSEKGEHLAGICQSFL